MKIALVRNPRAGNAMLEPNELRRRFENAGFDVLYVSTKEKNWEKTLDKQFDRIVIAGGDGTLSLLAPLLARRTIPFCILPLGTANNCAKRDLSAPRNS